MAGPAHLWANSFQMFRPCCVDSGRLLFNLKSLPKGLVQRNEHQMGSQCTSGHAGSAVTTQGPLH